jgi:hypothetical protein
MEGMSPVYGMTDPRYRRALSVPSREANVHIPPWRSTSISKLGLNKYLRNEAFPERFRCAPRFPDSAMQLAVGETPMQQGHDSIFRRLGKLLHDQDDDITHEPLPTRWVDLIHFLDEQERKRDEGWPAENKSRGRPEH